MLKPKKKITKKELKQDTLISTYARLTSFYYENKKYVSYAITGIIVIVVVAIVVMNNRRANNEKAETALGKIYPAYDAGTNDVRQYQMAIDGQPERGIMGLKAISENYGGTEAGEIATFYLANAYFNLRRYDEALNLFDKFSSGDKSMSASALAGEGSCYEAKKMYDKAASCYEKAANKVSDAITTPEYLHLAAQCYALTGDKEKATNLYKRLKRDFPTSTHAREAERYIAVFSA